MFGVPLGVSSSSPLLRRSGSKPVFSELGKIYTCCMNRSASIYQRCDLIFFEVQLRMQFSGASEVGNSGEEGFFPPVDLDEIKIDSSAMNTASILPSPVLLWRFKVSS